MIIIISDWLSAVRESMEFEQHPSYILATLLRRFYAEARSTKGKLYSKPGGRFTKGSKWLSGAISVR